MSGLRGRVPSRRRHYGTSRRRDSGTSRRRDSGISRRRDFGTSRGRDFGTSRRRDSGQVTVEFLGMTPVILATLVVLWQLVLVGYTYTLAGNAADEAVRAATEATRGARQGACQEAGLDKLPGAWEGGAGVECGTGGGYVTADVRIEVPLLFPGTLSIPFTVHGHAGAVEEEDD